MELYLIGGEFHDLDILAIIIHDLYNSLQSRKMFMYKAAK